MQEPLLDLKLLIIFDAVMTDRSITRAARRLAAHVPVAVAIQATENEVLASDAGATVIVNPTTPVVPVPPSVWLSMIGLALVGAYYGFRQRLA